jgi:AcrR family transcriptional regulator
MSAARIPAVSWEDRAAERSPSVQRSRARTLAQAKTMLDAAMRLIIAKGEDFTTQDLVKEAGVALQTFYRYFASKDELLLAVIGYAMTDACERWEQAGAKLPDPLARLRFYIESALESRGAQPSDATARFVVSTHWHLNRVFPKELADAEQPYVDLLAGAIKEAVAQGSLQPADPDWAAWFISELVRTVYHDYVYSEKPTEPMKEQLWQFCLRALGATDTGRRGSR